MTISCIIVSYNQEAYLRQAIESVLAQTRPVDEIIVADDASTDASRDLIRALAAEHQTIRPIFREANIGVAANRDLAIRAASGAFTTTLDGDDFFYPTKIEHEWASLAANPNSIAYSQIAQVDGSGSTIQCPDLSAFPDRSLRERLAYVANLYGPLPRDMLLTKDVYLRVGGFRHELRAYEDWNLKIRLAAEPNDWICSGHVGIAYRQTGKGLSSITWRQHRLAMLRALKNNQALLEESLGPAGYRRAEKNAPPTLRWWLASQIFNKLPGNLRDRLKGMHGIRKNLRNMLGRT